MISIIRFFEIMVMTFSTIFALTLGFMMIRLKWSNRFNIRDHVESNWSFDLDFAVIGKMRQCYVESYKDKITPLLNKLSFALMLICFVIYFALMVAKAI
jgi:hypothetical protein